MNPAAAVKKVPKWAWVASGGVVIGSIGLRYLRGNSAAAADGEEKQTTPEAGGAVDPYGVGAYSGGSVVVPSVTVEAGNDDSGFALALLEPLLGAFSTTQEVLLALPGEVLAGVQTGAQVFGAGVELGASTYSGGVESGIAATTEGGNFSLTTIQKIQENMKEYLAVANGGGAPVVQAPAGVVSAPAPALPNPAPTPAAPQPQAPNPPASTTTTRRCGEGDTGLYPFTNPVNGKCYRHFDEYKRDSDGKCYHYYWNLYFDGTRTARKPKTLASTGSCPK